MLQGLLSTAVVVGIFAFVFPRIASYEDVWGTIRAMTVLEAGILFVVGFWNLVTYWFVLTAVLPGLRLGQAAISNQASTAVSNTMPGGGILGVGVTFAMYRSWGFTTADFARATVVSGIWNNYVKLGMPIVALALLALSGDAGAAEIISAIVGLGVLFGAIVILWLMVRSEGMARKLGDLGARVLSRLRRLIRKPPIEGGGDSAVDFFRRTGELLKARWLRLTVSTLVSHISLYIVLLVALRNVGVSEDEIGWIKILAAYAFVRLISAIPITPGGLGVVELGVTAALSIGADEALDAQIVAAVLLFRFITFVLPIPLGAASYVFWRRNKSWRKKPVDAPFAT
ncbi:MAG: lysylphosphatidylglycerol synthase domain-containing protein [Acidimicrobiia bacterium]|nr:lysylphosphatidylglycerol synthase domain-containing protein [Acidimicrobiia bacterium]